MPVQLRPYQPEDLPFIQELFSELQTYEKNLLSDRADAREIFAHYWSEVEQAVNAHSGEVVVALENDVIVGYIFYLVEKDVLNTSPHLYVSDLVVAEEHRRKGIASLIMSHAEQYAKEHKLTAVRVGVLATSSAKSFYEKQGYELEALELKKPIYL